MNTVVELRKIAVILEHKRFEYHGTAYKLDVKATVNDNINRNLDGKPLKKLTGNDKDGNTLHVWSHDCRVASTDIGKIDVPKVVSTTTVPEIEHKPEKVKDKTPVKMVAKPAIKAPVKHPVKKK